MKLSFKYKLAVKLLRIISATWRFRVIGAKPQEPSIIAFWHGNMLPAWYFFRKTENFAVVSLSKDGEILSHLLKSWDYNLIRGSSSKKGKEVLDNIIEAAKSNNYLLITPDGPRGPIHEFKAGAVIAAQRSGKSLYLCGVKSNKDLKFQKSWDKFSLPLPFTKIFLQFSEAYRIPENASYDQINSYIEDCGNALNNIQNQLSLNR